MMFAVRLECCTGVPGLIDGITSVKKGNVSDVYYGVHIQHVPYEEGIIPQGQLESLPRPQRFKVLGAFLRRGDEMYYPP